MTGDSRLSVDGGGGPAGRLALAELSWPEVAAYRDGVELVLIPFGSTEQHGPNLAVSSDTALAESFALLASERMFPRLLVAPVVAWGVSPHHMAFPGTITLSAGTLLRLFEDIIGSLVQHGFKRFLVVNAHGGNRDISGVIAQELAQRHELDFIGAVFLPDLVPEEVAGRYYRTERSGHACESEVSDALYLCPDIVKRDSLRPAEFREDGWELRRTLKKYGVRAAYSMADITHNGALGDATRASLAAGKARMEAALESLRDLVDAITAAEGARQAAKATR